MSRVSRRRGEFVAASGPRAAQPLGPPRWVSETWGRGGPEEAAGMGAPRLGACGAMVCHKEGDQKKSK